MLSFEDLSILSEGHEQHDQDWLIAYESSASSRAILCFACAVDFCSDPNNANLKKRHILAALIDVIKENNNHVTARLRTNQSAASHVLSVCLELIWAQDTELANLSAEGIGLLVCEIDDKECTMSVMNTIASWFQVPCNYLESLPAFHLVGLLCVKLPWTADYLIRECGSLIEVICCGATFPTEEVRATSLFVLVQILKDAKVAAELASDVGSALAKDLVKLLKSEGSRKVLANALALLRLLLADPFLSKNLIQVHEDGASLPTGIKKVLLSRDEGLHVAAVQCLGRALEMQDQTFADDLMDNDLVEILGEILSTNNDLLTGSIFFALLNFTTYDNFFRKYHAVYGIDSIVNAIDRLLSANRHQSAKLAFPLLGQIFSSQPKGVFLFSSSRAAKKTISVLLKGINCTQRKISLDATIATAKFLRKDLLPNPVPLEDLVAVVSSCSKYLSDIFPTKKNRRRMSRGYSQAKELVTQAVELLDARLQTMLQLCRLIQECKEDPVGIQDPLGSADGPNARDVFGTLIEATAKAMDEVFIPVTMANMELIPQSSVYANLFSSLTALYDVNPRLMAEFFTRLSQGGILSWVWTVKNNGLQDNDYDYLKIASNCLLETILTSLTVEEEERVASSSKMYDFQLQDGDVEECLLIFGESDYAPFQSSEQVQVAQSTLIAFIYYVSLLGDRCFVTRQRLLGALTVFVQNNAELHKLPIHTQKHLLFLFSICQTEAELQGSDEDGYVSQTELDVMPCFHRMLQELKSMRQLRSVYTHHEVLLRWTFSNQSISEVFGSVVLQEWVLHSGIHSQDDMELEKRDLKVLLDLMSSNQLFLPAILELLVEGSEETLAQLLPILEMCCSRFSWEIRCVLLQALSGAFCALVQVMKEDNIRNYESNYAAILKTICQLQRSFSDKSAVEAADLKVVNRVCNLMGALTKEDSELWSLHYLYSLLSETTTNHDTKVLGMIMSNETILTKLSELLSSLTPHPVTLNLIAALTYYQARHKLQVVKSMTLDMCSFLRLISSSWLELSTAAIQLLSTLLSTGFNSPVLRVHYKNSDWASLLSNAASSTCAETVLRLLYFTLQNVAVKDDSSLQDAAFDCLGVFLAFVRRMDSQIGRHLMKQPWTATVLFIHMERILNGNWPEGTRLLFLILDFKTMNEAVSKFVEVLVTTVLERISGNNSQSDTHKFYRVLLKKVSQSLYHQSLAKNIRQEIEKLHKVSSTVT